MSDIPEGPVGPPKVHVEVIEQKFITDAQLDEMDRLARAYGWEVGRGHPLVARMEQCSDDNPFLDPNWKSKITQQEEKLWET